MDKVVAWDTEMVSVPFENNEVGLESFTAQLAQGAGPGKPCSFKPANIVVEQGVIYATIYVDEASNGEELTQQILIWLSSLKDTDHVHLTVTALLQDIPFFAMIDLLSGFASTKAKIDIHLDQIVFDSLAYFYLIADTITKGTAGALFIPSYVSQRVQDMSASWQAMHDFYKWIVDHAVERKLLTTEEADKLHRGSHVVVPNDRFTTV